MKLAKLTIALALIAGIGVTAVTTDAQARMTQCWRCTGGYCCY